MRKLIIRILIFALLFMASVNIDLAFAEGETVNIWARPNMGEKGYDEGIEAGIVVNEEGEEKLVDKRMDLPSGKEVTVKIKNGKIGHFKKWEAKKKGKKIKGGNFERMFGGQPTDQELTFTITDEFKGGEIIIEARFDMYVTIDTGKTEPKHGKVEVKVEGKDLKSEEGYSMATNGDKVEIKAIPNKGYEFDRWEFSREDFEGDPDNIIDKNSPEIKINEMNALFLIMSKVDTLDVTAYFKKEEGTGNDQYIKNITTQSGNIFNDFTIADNKIVLKLKGSYNYRYFANGQHSDSIANEKLIIETEHIEKIKVVNPYKSEDGNIVGKSKDASSAEWAKGIALSEIGITEGGIDENKIGFFKEKPLEFTFYTEEGEEFSLTWFITIVPEGHINSVNKTNIIRQYRNSNEEMVLFLRSHVYNDIYNFKIDALNQYAEDNLAINTKEIESIKVDNSGFNKDGYVGIVTDEISAEKWSKGVRFTEFGAEKDGEKIVAIDESNPPKLIFKTTYGEEFEMKLKLEKFISKILFQVDTNISWRDKDAKIEIEKKDSQGVAEGGFVDLILGAEYEIEAKDGVRSEFSAWELTKNIKDIDDNFEEFFIYDKNSRKLKVSGTEELIERFEKTNLDIITLKSNYNQYASIEIQLKKEEKRNNSTKIMKNSIEMLEYSAETEEYKDKIRLLKNSINDNYTHKLEDTMGEAYIILKDKDGKLKEKKVSPLNEDIILAYEGLISKNSDILELVAIPKEGYEFVKWQVITPAMDIEVEWDMPIDYPNPKETGVFAETESPYIKTKLENIKQKLPIEENGNRFRARAIFKAIDDSNIKEIENISDIHKEYIKGYTDISDVLLKSVEVKFKNSDKKVAIPVDWQDNDIENLSIGEHTIIGKLKDPRFSDKEVRLYLIVKEIVGFENPTQGTSVIRSNWFGEGYRHELPNTAMVKLNDGEKESVVELNIKWEEEELNSEESHKIIGNCIVYYKHGQFTATGKVKGYDGEIKYTLEVIPGQEVVFWIDDNFKKFYGDNYKYKAMYRVKVKKGELILEPEETPKRSGYIFVGWYSNASYSDPLDINVGKKFEFPQEVGENEMTGSSYPLYSKWRELFIDTIKNIEIEVDSQLPDKITINTTDKDIVEVDVKEWKQEGVDLSQAGEYTVKAIIEWKLEDKEVDVNIIVKDETVEKQKHTITFNTNGGSNIPPTEIEEGQKLTKPADPTREGYNFISWYSDEGLTEKFDFNTEIIENITLYAKWEEEPNEPIQEILEITSVELIKEGKVISKGVIKGKNITLELPEGYDESIIEGYHILKITGTKGANLAQDRGFDGPIEEWAAGNISNSIMAGQSKKFTLSKGDKSVDYTIEILEATEPTPPVEDEYTITFNSNGGSSVNPQILKANEKVYRPADPTKSDYKFIGWYEDSSLTRVFDFNTPITKNITLFAKWEKSDSPTPKPSEKKDARINKFSLAGIPGVINHDRETIDIYLPFNIDLDYLVPDISYDGDEIYPSISKPQDFNRTVYYTITGRDYNSKTYKVYVDMPRRRDRYDRQTYYEDWYKPLSGKTKGKSKDDKDWYEISQEIKKKRLEEEKSPSLTSKEVKAAALNKVGQITAQSGGIRRDVSIKQFSDHMEVKQNSKDKGDFIKNQINIPSGVLTELNELGFDYLKYSTNLVRVKIFPFMDSADGVIINIRPAPSERNNDIQYIWAKTKGAGKLFEIETNSTKAGLSFEMKLDKKLPSEYIRVVKFNYMKQKFEDLSPEKWSVVNERVYVEQVSGGIYGIIYKK